MSSFRTRVRYQVSKLISAEMNLLTKRFRNQQPARITFSFYEKNNQKLNCSEIIIKHFQNAGLWFGNKRPQLHWFTKICIFCFFITNLIQLIGLVRANAEPSSLVACISILTYCWVGFLKLCSHLVNHRLWTSLITQCSSLENYNFNNIESKYEYDSDDGENNDLSGLKESYKKEFRSISTYLSRVYFISLIVFMISPFIEYEIFVYKGSVDLEYPHILPGVATPLDSNIFCYPAIIIVEAIAASYCVRVHKAFDLTVIGLMIFIRGQFLLVLNLSERIGGKGNKCELYKKRDDRAHYRIKNCHHIHISLLKLVNNLVNLVQNILGIYFFVVTLTLCSVAVQLQLGNVGLTQLIPLLQHIFATLTQLFLFCYYGNAMLYQSSINQGEGPFGAAIWCLGTNVRREIAILGIGMSQSCPVLAGPFNTLDLPSFIQVVRAAYSIYAVLSHSPKLYDSTE